MQGEFAGVGAEDADYGGAEAGYWGEGREGGCHFVGCGGSDGGGFIAAAGGMGLRFLGGVVLVLEVACLGLGKRRSRESWCYQSYCCPCCGIEETDRGHVHVLLFFSCSCSFRKTG